MDRAVEEAVYHPMKFCLIAVYKKWSRDWQQKVEWQTESVVEISRVEIFCCKSLRAGVRSTHQLRDSWPEQINWLATLKMRCRQRKQPNRNLLSEEMRFCRSLSSRGEEKEEAFLLLICSLLGWRDFVSLCVQRLKCRSPPANVLHQTTRHKQCASRGEFLFVFISGASS